METYAEIFKALSDKTRLRILYLLIKSQEELCVSEFADSLEIPQQNISQHLRILRIAGLIRKVKEGRWIYFSITENIDAFTESVLAAISSIPERLISKDLKELDERMKLRSNGRCHIGIQKKHLVRNYVTKI